MNLPGLYRASNKRSRFDRCCSRPNGGFTLAEILVALGILAIGIAMVAAIFPAAMEFNRASTNDTLGTIICENGMVLSELALTAEKFKILQSDDNNTELKIAIDEGQGHETLLKRPDQHYPTGAGDARTGFVMMVRRTLPKSSVYQLVTVAYRKTDKDNIAILDLVTCQLGSGQDRNKITSASPTYRLKIGTPLINTKTGEFAYVSSINKTASSGTLEFDPSTTTMDLSSDGVGGKWSKFYVLREKKASGADVPNLRRSPAIQAMSKVTGLKHE